MLTMLLVAIIITQFGVMAAVRNGFNQVIRGLESIDERLAALQARAVDR